MLEKDYINCKVTLYKPISNLLSQLIDKVNDHVTTFDDQFNTGEALGGLIGTLQENDAIHNIEKWKLQFELVRGALHALYVLIYFIYSNLVNRLYDYNDGVDSLILCNGSPLSNARKDYGDNFADSLEQYNPDINRLKTNFKNSWKFFRFFYPQSHSRLFDVMQEFGINIKDEKGNLVPPTKTRLVIIDPEDFYPIKEDGIKINYDKVFENIQVLKDNGGWNSNIYAKEFSVVLNYLKDQLTNCTTIVEKDITHKGMKGVNYE